MPLPRFSQFTRGASVAKRNLPSLSSLSLSQPLIGTSASTPVTIAPGPTVVERLAKFQTTIGATGETIPLRIQGIAEKTFGGLTRYITRFPSTVVRTALQLDPEEKTFVGGFLADIGKNIESINQKPSKTFTEIGEEFKQSLPKVGFFKDMDPTAAGIALTVIDGWIAADLVKLSKDSLLLGARQIAQKLPREFLYQLEKSNLPAKDVLAALRGTGSSPEAQRFVASLNVEDVRLTKELFTSARTAERLGVGIQTEKAVGRTAIGKFAGVEEAPSFKDFTRMAPEQQLPGMAIIGKPQPKFGLSIQPVRRVGGLPEIPKKSVFLGKEAYEEGRGLAKISPQRETELKAIGERVKNAIPKELEPLAQSISQAKASGQSFDEWVKGQGEPMYHGTTKGGADGIEKAGFSASAKDVKYGDAVYLSPSKEGAKSFGHERSIMRGKPETPVVVEFVFSKKPNLKILESNPSQQEITKLKSSGYDGVKIKGKDTFDAEGLVSQPTREEIIVWNKDILKTRSQLKAEWDKIGSKVDDITTSIKSAKQSGQSFDEWVKGQGEEVFHGSPEKGFKLEKGKPLFLTKDFDSANTYAGYSYNTKPTGEVAKFYAQKGKTLDLNKTENVKKVFQEIYGSPKLKKAYDEIPETYKYLDNYGEVRTLEPKSGQPDFEDWMMMEYQSKPKIENGLKVRTGSYSFEKDTLEVRKNLQDAFSIYGKPTRQSVYNRWDDLVKYGKQKGYDFIEHTTESPDTSILFPEKIALNPEKSLKTRSQLKAEWDGVGEVAEEPIQRLPAVIQGETFTLGTGETIQPAEKELRAGLKAEIKATKKEVKNAEIAADKAAKLEIKQQKIRQEAIENIQRHTRGNTDNSIAQLKARNLSEEDIANIVLEDGTKLVDTVKVKRTADGTLSAVIKKSEIENIAKNYTDELPKQKWEKRSMLVEGVEVPIKAARSIELPYVYFERKGLSQIYDPIIQSGRDAETMKSLFLKRFKDAGLFKEGGWFTADRFNLPKSEAEGVANYYLGRQGRRDPVALGELSEKSRKFVEIFDGIIKETEDRFFEVAKKMGKTPSRVADYAPIMTSKDIKLVDQGGAMDWLFRNHPAFFSLKERVKIVPIELYELDYREVAARWLDGITQFLNYGETANRLKYLINSDQFKGMVKENDWQFISNWLREVTTPELPTSVGGQAANSLSRLLRKGVAMGSLGLNYASVAKQALTQIPILVIEKALPKLKSQYAKAFGVDVSQLPSITKRRGDIAIQDLQGKIGRVFTGALTQFDKKNAQLSLNALLDKEYGKFLKGGAEITPEIQKVIEKRAQDAIDMWYGGFFKGQRPEAFRKELGNFILMFLYPLTSQLNGFFRHILIAQGWSKARAAAEVLAAAVAIAYAEQVIENLSPQWSDEVGMTKDTLVSLSGNIPLLSQIVWAVATEQDLQISPVIGNINNIVRNIGKGEGEKVAWGIAETFGTPKQIRRIKEGLEIMEEGGITDNEGKMLAPVQDAMELTRSFLRGKYGSIASQDWLRNIGEKSEARRWFVPQVEFLQNGDYERKAELYLQFSPDEQEELRDFLSENQQKKLDSALRGGLPALRNLPQLPGLPVLPSNELPTLPSTKLPALPGLPKL